MASHSDRAKAQANYLDEQGYSWAPYEKAALRGILHALLALHEQNEPIRAPAPKPTRTRTTTQKAADK